MNMKTITVVAHLKAKLGQESALQQELLALIGPSRKDAGCLNYDLHQAQDNPALFMFHENWASRAHLDEHLQKPHLKAFFAKADALLAEPARITIWQKIG